VYLNLPRIPLEDWMREFYFATELDLGSSGLQYYSFPEFSAITGFSMADLEKVGFDDSETFGEPGLRQAIADRWGDGNAQTVLLGNGSNEIGFMLMYAMLNAGDEVVAMEPIYHTLNNLPEAIGCHVKHWPIRYEDHWQPDFEALERLLTPKTRMVSVNFPHNPTGISLTPEQQRRLVDMVSSVGAYLIWDAAFEDLIHVGKPLPSPRKHYDRCITTYTMSKCYGMPGVRLGWALCPHEVFENIELLKDYTNLYVSPLIEAVGLKAVTHAEQLQAGRMDQVKGNLARLDDWMEAHRAHMDWVRPMGGVTGFPRLINGANADVFCRALAKQEGVMLVPGTCFKNPHHVRLGFAGPCDFFEQGLDRLSRFLKRGGGLLW